MTRPTARVGRNRRRAFLYSPLLALGSMLVLTGAIVDGRYLLGSLLLIAAAGGFILDDKKVQA